VIATRENGIGSDTQGTSLQQSDQQRVAEQNQERLKCSSGSKGRRRTIGCGERSASSRKKENKKSPEQRQQSYRADSRHRLLTPEQFRTVG
jgi:hypothetical protein